MDPRFITIERIENTMHIAVWEGITRIEDHEFAPCYHGAVDANAVWDANVAKAKRFAAWRQEMEDCQPAMPPPLKGPPSPMRITGMQLFMCGFIAGGFIIMWALAMVHAL